MGDVMSGPAAFAKTGLTARAKRLFELYAFGRSRDWKAENRDAAVFLAVVMPIANISLLGWMVFYLVYDAASLWPAAAVCASFQITYISPWIARHSRFAAEVFASVMIGALFSSLMWMFGKDSGLTYAILIAVLLLVMEIGTRRPAALIICTAPLLALFWMLPIWFPNPQSFTNASPWLLGTIQFNNVINVIMISFMMVLLILRRAENAEIALSKEYDRSEALLANLVPAEIAAQLKDKPGEIIAEKNAAVTILFADIVDFTPKAAGMQPDALVLYLNRVFSAFDALAERHGLEKIKTIGDAYMAVSGMPVARADHTQAAAQMALDMIKVSDQLSAEIGEAVEVRIGLHTGSAVGGVIGTTKVFYDVWGDTVNTAARMESHGEAGRIQLTKEACRALGDEYSFTARGLVEIKGKGQIETFWLTGRCT